MATTDGGGYSGGQLRHLGRREPTSVSDGVRAFLGWPAAASAITLASGAVLLASAYGVIAPSIGDVAGVGTRFSTIGVVSAYLAALLGMVWQMCRWEAANPDAIGASVVGAPLMVGLGVTLDLVAVDRPHLTLLASALGLCGSMACWRAWNRATGGRSLVAPGYNICLESVIGWSFLWPAFMGYQILASQRHPEAANLHPMLLWIPGWWIVVGAGVAALVALLRGAEAWSDADRPFLARPAMRWVMLLLVLSAAGIHQYILGYTANLDFQWTDFAPLIAIIALIGNELRARRNGPSGAWDAATVLGLAALVAIGVACAAPVDPMNRGPGLARLLLRAQAPESTLIALMGAGAAVWWVQRRAGMLLGSAGALVAVILVWQVEPQGSLHALPALAATIVLCGILAAVRRQPRLALAAALAAELGAFLLPQVGAAMRQLAVEPVAAAAAIAGLTTLAAALALPSLLDPRVVRVAAWTATVGCLRCCVPESSALHAPWSGGIAVSLVMAGSMVRCQDRWLLAPISIPACMAAPDLIPDNKAWLGIWAAFALVGVALAVGWRRVRLAAVRAGPTPSIAAASQSPPDPGEP